MKTILIIVGAIVAVIGAIFGGQGAGLIPGSSMTGDPTWLYIGIVMVIAGVVLIVVGLRRGGASGPS